MQLFNIVNPSMFSLLTSKNRDTYVSSLFILRKMFMQEMNIEKDKLISTVSGEIERSSYELIDGEDDHIELEKIKDARSKANFIIKRFEETGWIECEYSNTVKFKEIVFLPPHSVKLLNVLYEISSEKDSPYTVHLYNIYSNLFSADQGKSDYRYVALSNAIDEVHSLENTLKLLNHDLRRRYRNIASLNLANDILTEHFDDYQKNIVEQIYLPLKTKDSISRFKGNIWKILIGWIRSPLIMEDIAKQGFYSGKYASLEEATRASFNIINSIIDKLDELETLVEEIDSRNNTYVSAVTQKLKHLLNSNVNSKKRLLAIMKKYKGLDDKGKDEFALTVSEVLNVNTQTYFDEYSLFVRGVSQRPDYSDPQEIDVFEGDLPDDLDPNALKDSRFTNKNILKYMESLLEGKDEFHIKDWKLERPDDLIMAILSTIKGHDSNVFYKCQVDNDTRIENMRYRVPDTLFIRRRK